jgi:hypothetical protein
MKEGMKFLWTIGFFLGFFILGLILSPIIGLFYAVFEYRILAGTIKQFGFFRAMLHLTFLWEINAIVWLNDSIKVVFKNFLRGGERHVVT